MNKPFQFKQENEEVTDLFIFGDITSWEWLESDVGAFSFSKELAEIDTPLNVHINSYGGEVAEGLAMYNMLKNFKHEITTICDGFACSIASVIFMAGNKRIMPKSSLLMIHNAWSRATGDSNDLKKAAEDLEKITQPSIEIYKEATGLNEVVIKEMMDVETWLSADEALDLGFATSIEQANAKQSLDNYHLQKVIMENKELKNQLKKINETKENEETKDAWSSFFDVTGGK